MTVVRTRFTSMAVALVAGSTVAVAQPCEWPYIYIDPGATGVHRSVPSPLPSPAPLGDIYVPVAANGMSFTPDRRPGYWQNMSGPSPTCTSIPNGTDNPLGMAFFWAKGNWDDTDTSPQTEGLMQRLDFAVANGFGRILLNRPGGIPVGQRVQQAHFHHLRADQKSVFTDSTKLPDWISTQIGIDPDFDIGVFIGSWQSGYPEIPCLWDNVNPPGGANIYWDCTDDIPAGSSYSNKFVNPRQLFSMQETYRNYIPWIDAGFTTIALDNSSIDTNLDDPSLNTLSGRDRTIELVQSPDYAGTRFMGEAVPKTINNDVDPVYAYAMPWIIEYKVLKLSNWSWHRQGSNPQSLDPAKTEVSVLFEGMPSSTNYTLEDVAFIRDSGFVPWMDSKFGYSIIQRLYDGANDEFYSVLTDDDVADFDADGDVDCDDIDLFISQWCANNGTGYTGPHAVWDGDVNGDDSINYFDFVDYLFLPLVAPLVQPSGPCSAAACPS